MLACLRAMKGRGEESLRVTFAKNFCQFCVILASEDTLLAFLIQALNSVRLLFVSTLSLKYYARG